MDSILKYIVLALALVSTINLNGQSTLKMKVYGICGMCQDRIETAAKSIIGVTDANWEMAEDELTVQFQEGLFQELELHQHLASVGHDTDKVKATAEVYNNLHGCCKYRDDSEYDLQEGDDHNLDVGEEEEEEEEENKDDLGGNANAEVDHSAHAISGMVYEMSVTGELEPLIGAYIYLANTASGTSTDVDGYFTFKKPNDKIDEDLLVVSYLGYENDTINMQGNKTVSITMKSSLVLDAIEVVHKRKSTQVSFIDPIKSLKIGQKELCKAACCNLSESFETTPSVDAISTDAITGTRKIEMLGLAGPYVQVTRENMPFIRGLAASNGFSYTPGTWVESIQLNMGAGSVVNGPESMTGQINVEIKKPELSEKLFLNLYANMAQRIEANLDQAFKINDKWSTGYLLHGNYQNQFQDRNNDGFQDMPDNTQFIAMNRWKYNSGQGKFAQFGIKGTYIDKSSGQGDLSTIDAPITTSPWRADFLTERLEGWAKIGKVFEDKPYASYGLQLSASYHNQEASFGDRPYNAQQTSLYANYIYQTIITDTKHQIKYGASYQFDDISEDVKTYQFDREEHLIGAFSEYQFVPNDKYTLVLGLRGDYHNNFGFFVTPRIHMKYNPNETTSWRIAAGRGQRTATIFSENIGLFASNRSIIIDNDSNSDAPYGLNAEISYNAGINFTKEIMINQRSAVFGIDYYYTTFDQQVVIDYDMNPQEVQFYNLNGRSYSHSIQSQIDIELLDGFDVRLAYRYNNPKTDFKSGSDVRPLVAKQRAFFNLAYETESKWSFDLTGNWISTKRIPSTQSNPEEYRINTESPAYFTFNGQVSKKMGSSVDVYVGGENLLDYRQENAIIQFDNPWGEYFDSSLVWGPVQGRVVYIGMRYRMP
ncbi:MAG: outer membrane receptor for ferrienterochelin and colicins [Saprospiraceae bacterium]|jgi:outer membrane receptor for ferrienterochelin and colicins